NFPRQANFAHGNNRVVHRKHGNFCRFHIRIGETMAFSRNCGTEQSSATLRLNDRLTLGLIGMGVIYASLGLGEAVYRFAFRDFDGATDRLPIEMLFGLLFAWMTTKLARRT